MQYLFIFIGGAVGALLRYQLSFLPYWYELPIGTLCANIIGAFFMGFLTPLSLRIFNRYSYLKKAITTGCLGTLTTFSTLQFEIFSLLQAGEWLTSFIYFFISALLGVISCGLGFKLGVDCP